MQCFRTGIAMRTFLLLTAILLAPVVLPCRAQSQGDTTAAASVDGARQSPAQAAPRAAEPRSAFGRVMAVLIAKLVQDSTQATLPHASQPRETADSNATTLPIDIEVGAAFRSATSAATATTVAGAPSPPVASPSDGNNATTQASEPLALQAALPTDGP